MRVWLNWMGVIFATLHAAFSALHFLSFSFHCLMLSCGDKWAGYWVQEVYNARPLTPLRDERCVRAGERAFHTFPRTLFDDALIPQYFTNKFFSPRTLRLFVCLAGHPLLLTKHILSNQLAHTRDETKRQKAGDLWSGKVQEMGGRKDERW